MSITWFCVFFLCFFNSSGSAYDDLLITVEDKLELLTQGSSSKQVPLAGFNASKLSVLTYDAHSRRLFFSDRRHSRGHIFTVDIDPEGQTGPVQDLIEKSSNESVEGLSYDPTEETLVWTDGLKQSIRKVRLREEIVPSVELVHFLTDDRPNGVVVDPCSRMLYWTNRNMERPSIERSNLNGSNREIIVQKDLLIPQGLDIDLYNKKLYWANNLRMGYFHIERSNLDGTNRELIYRGIGQFVFSLSVGIDYIYWSDWDQKAVWALPKEGTFNQPIVLRRYSSKPMAVTIFQRQPFQCDAPLTNQISEVEDNLCAGFCYNNGECALIENDFQCRCPSPFTGERCELIETANPQPTWLCPDLGNESQAELIILLAVCIVCATLLAAVILLSIRLSKLINRRRARRCPPSTGRETSVIDIENCCQSISLCERPCLQQSAGREKVPKRSDKAKLLQRAS